MSRRELPAQSDRWRDLLVPLAERAGEAIIKVYESGDFSVEAKSDDSPLTAADTAANDVILAGLAAAAPDVPVLSEETAAAPAAERAAWRRLWLVDPLDGTKEFIKRNGEFTVNIALVADGRPVVGVVHAPALGLTYYGDVARRVAVRLDRDGERALAPSPLPRGSPFRVVASRSHRGAETDAFLEKLPAYSLVPGGSSLKFCRVAEGAADLYPRLAPTMEWDTAAAEAVLTAAGGAVRNVDGALLRYNKENLLNPWFVAAGDPAWFAQGG